jgi:AhpD family alkylhydroperoxidase
MWNRIATLLGACLLLTGSTASAQDSASAAKADIQKTLGFTPKFFTQFPASALPGAWEEMKGLQLNPNTALSGEVKELIGLAVAAQVPCTYCVYAHTEFAELNGADAEERAEAVAIGAQERHASAYFYGLQNNPETLRAEVAKIISYVKQRKAPATAIVVTDAASAKADITQTLGFVPEFLRVVPDAALPGVWREMKELKLSPNTRLSAKTKALVSLAVASQVPSQACVIAETEFAKLAGATDREIAEAVGMAAITRNMSTLLNGLRVDMRAFVADIDKLVAGVKKAASAKAQKPAAAVASAKR